MKKNIEYLGQVFTSKEIVQQMLSLIVNNGNTLEPSCGDGAFLQQLNKNPVGIEYDSKVCPSNALNMNFFDYDIFNKFDTIIGNPPYVKYKNILADTKNKLDMSLFDERSNLFLFFIEKSIKHLTENGELIFIVPRDFIKASSAKKLNKFIYEQGTITHLIDLGDKIIFPGFNPNCVIFRFEKNNFLRKTLINENIHIFKECNGQLLFLKEEYPVRFSDLFFVKVGGASGADDLFTSIHGNQDFVCSTTKETGSNKKMFYNKEAEELLIYKQKLLDRKIKPFTDKNWFMWGRRYFESNLPRIYVNVKTRKTEPFFINECKAFDGSILAIFPKHHHTIEDLHLICDKLNQVNWQDLGFVCNGRYLFSQSALENTVLPMFFL